MSTPHADVIDVAGVLRGLVRPLYLPSALYSVGVGAAIPAQVLVGLEVGLAAATVALVIAGSGVALIAGTWWGGPVVERLGERRALVVATVAGVLPVILLAGVLAAGLPGAGIAYALTLAAFNFCDGVWAVARQELMAVWVPAQVRGRAVNTYGASQRAGRLVGPFIAAVLIVAIGPIGGFVVFAVAVTIGLVALLAADEPAHMGESAPPTSGVSGDVRADVLASTRSAFWVVGLGILALAIVRAQQEVLLPLWASSAVGLTAATVSVAMGLSLALEMVLFYPAGWVLDRYGSLPVVVACLVVLSAGFALLALPGLFWVGLCLIGLGGGIGSGIVKTIGLQLAPRVGRPRFLGRWQALASAGAVLGPLVVAATGTVSLDIAVWATVVVGLSGAVWLATAGRRHLVPRST
ncbi:MFS transporter [Janibacter anophelis]